MYVYVKRVRSDLATCLCVVVARYCIRSAGGLVHGRPTVTLTAQLVNGLTVWHAGWRRMLQDAVFSSRTYLKQPVGVRSGAVRRPVLLCTRSLTWPRGVAMVLGCSDCLFACLLARSLAAMATTVRLHDNT